tara:strand:+ start:1948 stop:2685 length:738 start_codon:yes stop_codon:yes gene_type:complete
MAFKTGTQVDPRLMRADLSGFQRGAELQAAGIGAAIKGYQKGKKEKEEINFASEALLNSIKTNDYVRQAFGFTDAEAETLTANDLKPTIKGYGAKTALALSAQINLATTKAAMDRGTKLGDRTSKFLQLLEKSNLEVSNKGELRNKAGVVGFQGKPELDDARVKAIYSAYPELFTDYFGDQYDLKPSAESLTPAEETAEDFSGITGVITPTAEDPTQEKFSFTEAFLSANPYPVPMGRALTNFLF